MDFDNNCKIAYVYSKILENECNKLPTMLNRASIVQDLIDSYNLLSNEKITLSENQIATEEDLKLFHASNYVEFLKQLNDADDYEEYENEQEEFGLGYDCPILDKIFDFAQNIAGASLTAANLLVDENYQIAINWFGGWHHAQRDEAEGFCYVNDIVIAIQKLTQKFKKILYLDLDIHHGNGVQNAFEFSNRILTLSFHICEPGFYPGSGMLDDIGSHKGRYHSLNVPLRSGVSTKTYHKIFNDIYPRVIKNFKPEALVVQCGADCLNGDPLSQSNLTLKTIGSCIEQVLKCNIPTLFLGGGGYNFANTARLWSYLTSLIIGCDLNDDIPDNSKYFTMYGPTYELHIDESLQKDLNSEDYVNKLITTISGYCVHLIS